MQKEAKYYWRLAVPFIVVYLFSSLKQSGGLNLIPGPFQIYLLFSMIFAAPVLLPMVDTAIASYYVRHPKPKAGERWAETKLDGYGNSLIHFFMNLIVVLIAPIPYIVVMLRGPKIN